MAADPVVVLVGTLDTKGHELEYMRDRVREAGAEVVMVGGQIAAETTAKELEDDPDAQRRYLGVEPIATEG
jgi:uncharacterized protein (UPF0261 family)